MGQAQEGYVQVAPDSTGKKVRNLQVILPVQQPDGTWDTQTVLMQVVALAVESGRPIDLSGVELNAAILEELREIRKLLEHIAE